MRSEKTRSALAEFGVMANMMRAAAALAMFAQSRGSRRDERSRGRGRAPKLRDR